jgi:AcrR family transcriptional regulator
VPPGRRGPRPRFTLEQVLETALRLIDDCEPGSFTMRRLADEMGMAVMTLYGYVSSKEELYAAVTAKVFADSPHPPDSDLPWPEQIRTAVTELHDIARRHPNLLRIVLSDASPDPGLFSRRERVLAALNTAGFPPDMALHAFGALISFAVGFAVAQGSALRNPPAATDSTDTPLPAIAAAGAAYARHLEPEAFDFGLNLLIDGLRAEGTAR